MKPGKALRASEVMVTCRLTEHGKDCTVASSFEGSAARSAFGPRIEKSHATVHRVFQWERDTGGDWGIPVMIVTIGYLLSLFEYKTKANLG